MQNREEALSRAQEAVRRAVDVIRSGGKVDHYEYKEGGLREEILEEIALRLLAPHGPQDPADPGTLAIQEQLGSDRLFIRLCRLQKSFRARLSPKPWRVRMPRPTAIPREGAAAESRFQEWLDEYRRVSEPHATCCFLKAVGSTHAHPGFIRLVQLHDDRTKAFSGLPLA